jgi:hypothetical protein
VSKEQSGRPRLQTRKLEQAKCLVPGLGHYCHLNVPLAIVLANAFILLIVTFKAQNMPTAKYRYIIGFYVFYIIILWDLA